MVLTTKLQKYGTEQSDTYLKSRSEAAEADFCKPPYYTTQDRNPATMDTFFCFMLDAMQ
jgi:hypothetical protein